MISVLGIDELNTPKEYKERSIDYEKYFGEMDLTKEQKENRIATANEMENLMLFIFALLMTMNEYGLLDFNYVRQQITSRYETIMGNAGAVDDYLRNHAEDFADSFIESTEIKMDNPWYLSEDRARFIAENEANVVHNYLEYEKAIKAGYTKKQWITLMDGKERPSHAKLNKKIIPITEFFVVGDALMRFPKDTEYASDFPREIVRCRCTVKYFERDPDRAVKDDFEQQSESKAVQSQPLASVSDPIVRANTSHNSSTTTETEPSRKKVEKTDATQEYIDNSVPESGTINKEPGFVDKNGELKMGEWLHDTFGGEIVLLEEKPEQLNPDYLWNGKLWDLKSLSSDKYSTIEKRIRHGLKQISGNPGGIIYDIVGDLDLGKAEEYIDLILQRHMQNSLDVILRKGDTYKVIRYKN